MKKNLYPFILWLAVAYVAIRSVLAFQKIAWGTGVWYGEYSLKWGVLYFLFFIVCAFMVVAVWLLLWRRDNINALLEKLIAIRERLGIARWLFVVPIFFAPVWFFQYTPWGVVFSDVYIRLLTWVFVAAFLSFLAASGNVVSGWKEFLIVILLTSAEFVIAVPFMNVTDYPFSLGWSEGNRMWDYSILFGRDLYDYPADGEIFVLLDVGRQFVGGLPFIFPGITIKMERFWVALTVIIPYLLLGLAAFRSVRPNVKAWLLGAAWVLIFLKQGPIHPPLILSAAVVALLWKRPLWLAIPLIAFTAYLTEESRFTWVFAPGLWIAMLEMAGASLLNGKLSRETWVRTISLGLAGFVGGQFGQQIAGLFAGTAIGAATSVDQVVTMVSTPTEPLLWYRLLPNATYGVGIIVGLLIATLPLIALLIYLIVSKKWQPNPWQKLSMLGPLSAFLVVGFIVSTKIGGGGDLHNMDMFLITLVFVTILAWRDSGSGLFSDVNVLPTWVKITFILLFALPGFHSLTEMRGFDFGEDAKWLMTLTDVTDEKFLAMYPSSEAANHSLDVIRQEVERVRSQNGDVLFLDQRQLLTFGYVSNVPLIPEYEKKILMTQALSSDHAYFENFYTDLKNHRFELIVSEPLRTPVKDSSFEFGEENNAWVTWVSNPVLCYYEPIEILKEVNVHLLVPKSEPVDCSAFLP
ncbi:MAG: hypothetical protein HYZ21_05385 [Chloroflexi bacterium]|nr:hypothetical protein [Chloroflexota bacterium]